MVVWLQAAAYRVAVRSRQILVAAAVQGVLLKPRKSLTLQRSVLMVSSLSVCWPNLSVALAVMAGVAMVDLLGKMLVLSPTSEVQEVTEDNHCPLKQQDHIFTVVRFITPPVLQPWVTSLWRWLRKALAATAVTVVMRFLAAYLHLRQVLSRLAAAAGPEERPQMF